MKGTGQALSHGAISILNAFPTGKGGALGVDLWTRAKVSLREGPGPISGFVSSDPEESNRLAGLVVCEVEDPVCILQLAEWNLELGYECRGPYRSRID